MVYHLTSLNAIDGLVVLPAAYTPNIGGHAGVDDEVILDRVFVRL